MSTQHFAKHKARGLHSDFTRESAGGPTDPIHPEPLVYIQAGQGQEVGNQRTKSRHQAPGPLKRVIVTAGRGARHMLKIKASTGIREWPPPLAHPLRAGHSPLVLIEVLDNTPGDDKQQGKTWEKEQEKRGEGLASQSQDDAP